MFIKNCWYVAGWANELPAEATLARRILDEPIVFYRRSDRKPVALADRCAHRLAPLSLGRIEGDNLRCMYHGLAFNGSGTCVEIPGQAVIPPNTCVRSYPVVEQDRLLWIWMGEADRADPAQIPPIPALDDPNWPMKPGSLHFRANYLYVLDNLLDFSHLSYVHPTTVGGTPQIALARPKIERMRDGVRIERWVIDAPPAPFQISLGNFTGNVDRWHFYDVLVPGIMIMESGVQTTGTGASDGRHEGALRFRPVNILTPETETTTHYFYALPHDFAKDDEAVNEQLFRDLTKAFEEDRTIIEAQQRVIDATPNPKMMPIQADTALGYMRWVIDQRLRAERAPSTSSDGSANGIPIVSAPR